MGLLARLPSSVTHRMDVAWISTRLNTQAQYRHANIYRAPACRTTGRAERSAVRCGSDRRFEPSMELCSRAAATVNTVRAG
jgi:hypothetical protein